MTVQMSSGPFGADPAAPSPPPISIGGGLGVYQGIILRLMDEPDIQFDAEIVVAYDEQLGRFVAESVLAMRRENGTEVTSAMLRSLRIQEYIKWAVPHFVVFGEPGAWTSFGGWDSFIPDWLSEEVRQAGPTPSSLEWVARIYRLAQTLNQPPASAVAEHLEIAQRTASHWIAKAKASGLIGRDDG